MTFGKIVMRPRDKAAVLVLIEALLVFGVVLVVRTAWSGGHPMFAIGFGLALVAVMSVWFVRVQKNAKSSGTMDGSQEEEHEPEVVDRPIDKVWLWLTAAASLLVAAWAVVHFTA